MLIFLQASELLFSKMNQLTILNQFHQAKSLLFAISKLLALLRQHTSSEHQNQPLLLHAYVINITLNLSQKTTLLTNQPLHSLKYLLGKNYLKKLSNLFSKFQKPLKISHPLLLTNLVSILVPNALKLLLVAFMAINTILMICIH